MDILQLALLTEDPHDDDDDYYFPKSYTIVGQSSFQGVMLKFGHRCNLNHLSGDEFCIVCNLLQVDFYQWEIFRGSWDF